MAAIIAADRRNFGSLFMGQFPCALDALLCDRMNANHREAVESSDRFQTGKHWAIGLKRLQACCGFASAADLWQRLNELECRVKHSV